jgi:hypothetical protein
VSGGGCAEGGGHGPDVDAISLSPRDNVATVLRAVAAGERLRVRCGDSMMEVTATEAIPLCHKIGLVPLAPGASVIKYGEPIGETLREIPAGCHVHVHNIRSARAQNAARAGTRSTACRC